MLLYTISKSHAKILDILGHFCFLSNPNVGEIASVYRQIDRLIGQTERFIGMLTD
jgi:hypothetical protein